MRINIARINVTYEKKNHQTNFRLTGTNCYVQKFFFRIFVNKFIAFILKLV
jgi:hypothetical protein